MCRVRLYQDRLNLLSCIQGEVTQVYSPASLSSTSCRVRLYPDRLNLLS